MEVGDLIAAFRQRSDDAQGRAFATDAQAMAWLNEAEREASIRAKLLFDDTPSDLTTFTFVADQTSAPLDPLVNEVISAFYQPTDVTPARAYQLELVGRDWLDDQRRRFGTYYSVICSRPKSLAHVPGAMPRVDLWTVPSTGGTLQLAIYRQPLNDMDSTSDEPEIPAQHHDNLVDWMIYRAFTTKDGEVGDDKRAAGALADFTARFGERSSASVMRTQQARRRVVTRCI